MQREWPPYPDKSAPEALEWRWNWLTNRPSQVRIDHAIRAEAIRFADRVAMVRASATRGEPESSLPVRDIGWLRTALFWHDLLQDAAIDVTLGRAEPRCRAPEDAIRAWLTGPPPVPQDGVDSAAEFWSVDDTFRLGDADLAFTLTVLIEQAQRVGVFGVAEHHIELLAVRGLVTEFDGHLITLTDPAGLSYASGRITIDALLDPTSGGIDAAAGALQRTAAYVDDILAAQGADWLPIARSPVVNDLTSYLYADMRTQPATAAPLTEHRPSTFPNLDNGIADPLTAAEPAPGRVRPRPPTR